MGSISLVMPTAAPLAVSLWGGGRWGWEGWLQNEVEIRSVNVEGKKRRKEIDLLR